jgi:hypothetical protein
MVLCPFERSGCVKLPTTQCNIPQDQNPQEITSFKGPSVVHTGVQNLFTSYKQIIFAALERELRTFQLSAITET